MSILPLSSRVAFCVSPTCPTTRSTASADTKQPFGAKSARSCLRLMPWIAANHKIGGAVSVSAADKNCLRTRAMTIDFRTRDRGMAGPGRNAGLLGRFAMFKILVIQRQTTVRRTHQILDQRPSVVHAVSGSGAGAPPPGCAHDLAASGEAYPGWRSRAVV